MHGEWDKRGPLFDRGCTPVHFLPMLHKIKKVGLSDRAVVIGCGNKQDYKGTNF